ncbi:MAG: ABC transporter permease [Lachnospiraceae bacterium]|nr:ABC transporter permease [Lachnospiraceae bacterium]
MGKYIVKKIASLSLTLIAVSFVVFFLFSVIPGDPAVSKLGTNATPEKVEALREELGLNAPFMVRYFKWLTGIPRGDFGKSYAYSMPVSKLIGGKLMINGTLSLMAILIVVGISVPVGVYTAKHTGGLLDKIITVINQVFMAFPPFLLGLILTFVFGMVLKLFSPGAYVGYDVSFARFFGYLICPAIALALPKTAMCIKLLRTNILEEAKKDYAKTAYSKGNNTTGLLYKYVLKNAIMPTITFVGMVFADMIASGIVIEQTFGIPGLGRSLLSAISVRDYPVVEAIVMLIAFGIVIVSALTDVIHAIVDPQVREE